MAKQKQPKQPMLITGKNIFTYFFQSIQRLKPNSKTYAIRNFMYTKYNGDNPKLNIFLFIPQRRRIQPNFMNHTYQTTNQTNNPNNQNKDINVGFTTNTSFVLLQLRQRKFWSIHTHISTNFKKFIFNQSRTFISSITNLYISLIPKNLYVAWWTISYISSITIWIHYQLFSHYVFQSHIVWLSNFPKYCSILNSVICSEMNSASITNKRLL